MEVKEEIEFKSSICSHTYPVFMYNRKSGRIYNFKNIYSRAILAFPHISTAIMNALKRANSIEVKRLSQIHIDNILKNILTYREERKIILQQII